MFPVCRAAADVPERRTIRARSACNGRGFHPP